MTDGVRQQQTFCVGSASEKKLLRVETTGGVVAARQGCEPRRPPLAMVDAVRAHDTPVAGAGAEEGSKEQQHDNDTREADRTVGPPRLPIYGASFRPSQRARNTSVARFESFNPKCTVPI